MTVGLLSIESQESGEHECIYSHSREVNPASKLLNIPLNAATILELTGEQYIHGYLNLRFGSSHKNHQLVARARQFSAFVIVIGTMTDGSTLDPKDAIIVQNKVCNEFEQNTFPLFHLNEFVVCNSSYWLILPF